MRTCHIPIFNVVMGRSAGDSVLTAMSDCFPDVSIFEFGGRGAMVVCDIKSQANKNEGAFELIWALSVNSERLG